MSNIGQSTQPESLLRVVNDLDKLVGMQSREMQALEALDTMLTDMLRGPAPRAESAKACEKTHPGGLAGCTDALLDQHQLRMRLLQEITNKLDPNVLAQKPAEPLRGTR
jgi:hypothetical protein